MQPDARAAYESYKQICEESQTEVLYDVDERPMMIRRKGDYVKPLSWGEWLHEEMAIAVYEEDYMYAAQLRDEIAKLNNK
jgi:protein-arginine kinase activator protein McsA